MGGYLRWNDSFGLFNWRSRRRWRRRLWLWRETPFFGFSFEDGRRPISRWEELKRLVLRKFRSGEGGTLVEQWLGHSQTGDFGDYCRRFIELIAPLKGVQDDVTMGQFIQGLTEEVKMEVRTLEPVSLEDAMEKATRVAERVGRFGPKRNWAPGTSGFRPILSKNLPTHSQHSTLKQNPPNLGQNPLTILPKAPATHLQQTPQNFHSNNSTNQRGKFRRMSERELLEKREKGLCFRCDGKWSIGHQCNKSKLSVILVAEGRLENMELGDDMEELEEEKDDGAVQAQLSMNSLVGYNQWK